MFLFSTGHCLQKLVDISKKTPPYLVALVSFGGEAID